MGLSQMGDAQGLVDQMAERRSLREVNGPLGERRARSGGVANASRHERLRLSESSSAGNFPSASLGFLQWLSRGLIDIQMARAQAATQ